MSINHCTDFELIDSYCENCIEFIDPKLFREIDKRGLYGIINLLPNDVSSRKTIARARLSKSGRYMGDPEIEQIADIISRLEDLRESLVKCNLADIHITLPIVNEMADLSTFLKNYFSKTHNYG